MESTWQSVEVISSYAVEPRLGSAELVQRWVDNLPDQDLYSLSQTSSVRYVQKTIYFLIKFSSCKEFY